MERGTPSRVLPTGTVTFLFTDIEGSTERWERDREAMQGAVRRHDALLRDAIESHGGYVFKTIGDAFCAAFARPEDAVAAALDAQRRLLREDFSNVDGVRVRMALHTGTADERDGDYFGVPVNRVARLLAAGHGGQVLLSHATGELVRGTLPSAVDTLDLGKHRFKGLDDAMPVLQLVAEVLPKTFPPLRTAGALVGNVPVPVTSFIGRLEQLSVARRLLGESRLLTLAGTGGVGKTRLSIALATEERHRFADGAWFVDLAPLTDEHFVSATILSTMGVREDGKRDTTDTLVDYLHEKAALIVLDNCEHVIGEAANVASRLLAQCPQVRIVATSRHLLEVPGEVVHRVSTFGEDEGVELFISRAKALAPEFAPTPQDVETIGRICSRLDGIALAIVLAAARVRMMSVDELARRLDDRFRLLTGGSRTELPRQQTLRGLIEWSYNLLDEPEKTVLRRISAFIGDFSLDAATAVCSFHPIDEYEAVDVLAQLIDKSLVRFDSKRQRYRLYESTKEFAAERLREASELGEVQDRHARHYQALADAVARYVATPEYDRVRDQVTRDYAELRGILTRELAGGSNVVRGAEIAAALGSYWQDLGKWREGHYWLEQLTAREDAIPPKTLALGFLELSRQRYLQGALDEMIATARRAGDLYASLGDRSGECYARHQVATAALVVERFEEARELFERNLSVAREIDDERLEAMTLVNLANTAAESKDGYDEAADLLARAIEIFRRRGQGSGLAIASANLGSIAVARGEFERADALAQESLEIFRHSGEETRIIASLIMLGHLRAAAGWPAASAEPLREASERLRPSMNPIYVAAFVEACAELAARSDLPVKAALLWGFADGFREQNRIPRQRDENEKEAVDKALERLGRRAFDESLNAGRALPVESVWDHCDDVLSDERVRDS